MEEILHHLIGSVSHYFQGFIHPRWLFGISSINSISARVLKQHTLYTHGGMTAPSYIINIQNQKRITFVSLRLVKVTI